MLHRIPCSSQVDLLVSDQWVDFCLTNTDQMLACWDVKQRKLTVYSNPTIDHNDVCDLATAIRCFSFIASQTN